MPPKLNDPGSFTIPCTNGKMKFDKVLCDLGAIINLMPYSISRKLKLGETKAALISLQLADMSIRFPRKIVEDILLKINKFIYLVDFVILDMVEEAKDEPLILGRLFLVKCQVLIDVQKG